MGPWLDHAPPSWPGELKARALRADGAAALEFAFVAAPLIALILASIQTSLVFFVQQSLQTTVEVATRSIITGQTQASDVTGTGSGMSQAQLQARFKQTACTSLPRFLSCTKLYIDVQSAPYWSAIDTTSPVLTFDGNGNVTNQFNYKLGGSGEIVLVRMMYLWPVQTAPLGFNLSNTSIGKRLITAISVAKIENYNS